MKVETMALAFRIWANCETHGWERTSSEIAEDLDTTTQKVANTLRAKGWSDRVRPMPRVRPEKVHHSINIDNELGRFDGGRGFEGIGA